MWTPFLSDSVYLVPERVFSFLPFILICVFFEWFPFFQERVTLYFPQCFFFFIILILDGLPGRIFFFAAVPGDVCCVEEAGVAGETVEAACFSVETAGISGETVEEGDGGRSLAAKPS